MYAARQAIAKHMENYSFYKSSFSRLNDEIKLSRADSSQYSGEAAERFKYFFFVDFFPKFFFRLKYAARQAIAKHMENYSFYKSSFSPLNDEINLVERTHPRIQGKQQKASSQIINNNKTYSFVTGFYFCHLLHFCHIRVVVSGFMILPE